MDPKDCVLAATGGEGSAPLIAVAVVLVVAGALLFLRSRARRRGLLAVGVLAVLGAVALGVVATPAPSASAACVLPSASPSPSPSAPNVQHPDLAPTVITPAEPIASSTPVVVSVSNAGPVATSGPIEFSVEFLDATGFAVELDASATEVVVDGVTYDVQNGSFSITGGGAPGVPWTVVADVVLAPGSSLSIAFTVTPTGAGAGVPLTVRAIVTAGTGGGETPTDNNQATGTLSAVAGGCFAVNDKSSTGDSDGDGVVDACDLDSDNDGVLDAEEDLDSNGRFEDDDVDGDLLIIPVLGDGVSTYLDLDSENDGILDLMEGRAFTRAQIDLFDADHDGVFDPTFSFGANGLLDDLETSPDSGVLRPEFAALRNTDGDDKPDWVDASSNGSEFDLYQIGRSDLDTLGGGFITPTVDADRDGIQIGVDTDLASRGAPGSPYSPYSS
ncbi:thrombospondin type 3 repeat-containing protein [Microbacterium sp. NPDC057944]|uniref:thrombospondin type 3 repeat-containing protein n=1 Tax=Microbacterium sp. NPDC057944 TaxID=3346286 RepID=UPI0036DAFC88